MIDTPRKPDVPRIFDADRTAAKWARARDRQRLHQGTRFLAETMAEDVAERIDFMRLEPASAHIVGDQSSLLAARLEQAGARCERSDLGSFNAEVPSAHGAYDLIVHLVGLGMVNDLPGAMIHARNALAEGGLFIAAFPGAGSVPLLRRLALAADGDRPAARIHPQVDNRAGTALLERAGFARQVVDSYRLTVRYRSLAGLISDLRDQGLTASLASPAPPLTRAGWARAEALFDSLRDEVGKVAETFEILTLTGWR